MDNQDKKSIAKEPVRDLADNPQLRAECLKLAVITPGCTSGTDAQRIAANYVDFIVNGPKPKVGA